jgi:2-polyprenyl-6-methoxyphenol hydroxylase-like FAD-dependent oxidoreductase
MGKQRIAIVGAGIGGLAAAALLGQLGHRVRVFDRFETPRPVGSGLVIQPVGQAVLAKIGAEISGLGARITQMSGIEVDQGRIVLSVAYDRPGGPRYGLAIHRAALFQALFDAALTAGADLVASTPVLAAPLVAGGRALETASGRLGPFDLVVDAGGAASPLSPLAGRTLPYGAVWGTVPWPADAPRFSTAELSQRYRRASHMAGVLPLGRMWADGTAMAAIFWSLPLRELDLWSGRNIEDWKAEVIALWPDMAPFLATVQTTADMTPARYSHGTLRHPFGERLVHIGDAAHRASPQLGQGANMALLDALALAEAVASSEDPGPDYARARRWHVRLYQRMSAAFTPQYQCDSRWLPVLRDRILMPVSRVPPVPRILTRLVAGDLIPPLAGSRFPPDAAPPSA